jgi:hypothetical protein
MLWAVEGARAGWFWFESFWDSPGGGNLIQAIGRMEVGGYAQTVFPGSSQSCRRACSGW